MQADVESCVSCRRPRGTLHCEICQEPICRDCSMFLDSEAFSFLDEVPAELSHSNYCPCCHDAVVAPARAAYEATLEQARGVYIFFDSQRRPLPILRRSLKKVQVEACADRDETILRLAFQAAQQGFNAVLDTSVTAAKVRNEGYQKSRWTGVGRPVQVDAAKVERY